MNMENLIIQGGNSLPHVEFNINGKLKIQGRIITDNPINTFEPLILWINKMEAKKIEFSIELDYINTSASKQLFSMLRLLDENSNIDEILVKWYYEADDDDHLETGEFFEDKLNRVEFEYLAVKDQMVA
jgi:hypothetical protein